MSAIRRIDPGHPAYQAALHRTTRFQCDAPPGDGQAPGADDTHQVQAGSGLRGVGGSNICPPCHGISLWTNRARTRCPAGSSGLINF